MQLLSISICFKSNYVINIFIDSINFDFKVEVMFMQHYFVETNGICNCTKCQLASLVLKFHSSKCQIPFCEVCMRWVKLMS